MEKKFEKMLCLGVALLLSVVVIPGVSAKASTAEKTVEAHIVVPEEEVYSAVTYAASNGIVNGNGVRLRKKPSSSAEIIGLMYDNDRVYIYVNSSTANWYYLKHLSTGNIGYASKSYVILI